MKSTYVSRFSPACLSRSKIMRKLPTQQGEDPKFYSVQNVTIMPRPWQKNGLPIWIGGRSQAAMRRTGRLGDGWLVSSVSPAEVKAGIKTIRAYAADAGREVPEDHYGVLIPFYFAADSETAFDIVARSIRPRADLPMSEFTAFGNPDQVRAKVQAYIAAGATKFVMRPCGPFEAWREQTEILAREVIQPLQTPTD